MVIISGPSGAGKRTVIAAALERRPEWRLAVSATTRPPRPNEVDGRDYYFVDNVTFDAWIEEGRFAEWEAYAGRRYGTLVSELSERSLLEIDVRGAERLRDRAVTTIFLAPPSFDELERRLRVRGTDGEERILSRLERARTEMVRAREFEVVIVNNRLDEAIERLIQTLDHT